MYVCSCAAYRGRYQKDTWQASRYGGGEGEKRLELAYYWRLYYVHGSAVEVLWRGSEVMQIVTPAITLDHVCLQELCYHIPTWWNTPKQVTVPAISVVADGNVQARDSPRGLRSAAQINAFVVIRVVKEHGCFLVFRRTGVGYVL